MQPNLRRMKLLTILTLFIISCAFSGLYAQTKFSHLTIEEGLSQSTINSICQDAKGYIWLGTCHGLNKYDGYEIVKYYSNPDKENSLPDNEICSLYVSPYDSIMWLGTKRNGLAVYNYETNNFSKTLWRSKNNRSPIFEEIIQIIAPDKDHLWIATLTKGIHLLNKQDSSCYSPSHVNDMLKKRVSSLKIDRNGNLWIATHGGLYCWSKEQQISHNAPNKIDLLGDNANYSVLGMDFDQKGNLYIGTQEKGLFKYNPISKSIISFTHPDAKIKIDHRKIKDVFVRKNGTICIATQTGISILDPFLNNITNHNANPLQLGQLNSYSTKMFFEDNSGILFIGTFLGGANILDPKMNRFHTYNNFLYEENTIPQFNQILRIFKDKHNSIWINTSEGLLEIKEEYFTKSNSNKYIEKHYNRTLYGDIYYDKQQGLFLSFGDGIYLRKDDGTLKKLSSIIYKTTGKKIYSFLTAYTDSDGMIWFSINGGLLQYQPQDNKFDFHSISTDHYKYYSTNVQSITELKNGKLLLGNNNGDLFSFDRYTKQYERILTAQYSDSSVSFSNIHSILESQSDIIWLGTDHGLHRLDLKTNSLKSYYTDSGLSNNMIYGLLLDKEGKIWCSTNYGLSVYCPKDNVFLNYTHLDGLQSNEFNQCAYYQDNNDIFYFGGINGINVFNPNKIKLNPFIPPVFITKMEIDYAPVNPDTYPNLLQKEISFTNQIKLNYKQSTFSFQYNSLSFTQPEKNHYLYKLEGYDDRWINAKNRRIASYTNIPPGEYTFMVKGSNSDGIWNNTPVKLKITITPPFWKSIWFRSIIILVFCSSLYLIFFLRYRELKRQRVLLIKKVKQKTETLQLQKQQIKNQNKELRNINRIVQSKNNELKNQYIEIAKQRDKVILMKEKVEQINRAKISFFTQLSHELRTPLTLIISPLKETILNFNQLNSYEVLSQLKTTNKNAQKLLSLVNQLLDFRKVEEDKARLNISKIELISFTSEIIKLFTGLISSRHINVELISPCSSIYMYADGLKLERILTNLISNAIKFCPPENGEISVNIDAREINNMDTVQISIKDNGEGIDNQNIEKLFDPFYQELGSKVNKQKGSGLGLYIAKKYTALHEGRIYVNSIKGIGSTFSVEIPSVLHKDKFIVRTEDYHISEKITNEIESQSYPDSRKLSSSTFEKSQGENKEALLIIEDNHDISNYLKENLSNNYHIFIENNAETGLEKAQDIQPILIVCDVMLPGISGFDFCKRAKNDFKTSHIPIILLTALSDHENRIEGLKVGADAYINKPFDLQHLKLKIKNLIDQHQHLKNKFIREISFDVSEIAEERNDKTFINKAIKIIEDNLSNTEFNVDTFCSSLAISHSHVYRKIKGLTDLSIAEFIRNIRLKNAARILLSQDIKINEVAYATGFKDPNYFTKCFCKQYGLTPREYIKNSGIYRHPAS